MSLQYVETDVLRAECKRTIESLERWLRRLIHDQLSTIQSDYLLYEVNGSPVFGRSIREVLTRKAEAQPNIYPRVIDAATLEEQIAIITNEMVYNRFFSDALKEAFPEGRNECRSYLSRLIVPRNLLSHANEITIRHAERVFCYSNDVIESLKDFYVSQGKAEDYNVPLIVAYRDGLGRHNTESGLWRSDESINLWDTTTGNLAERPKIRVGETVFFEVDIDPAFSEDEYTVMWTEVGNEWGIGRRVTKTFSQRDINQRLTLMCLVRSNKDWHRLGAHDDVLYVHMSILPSAD